jgi:hypothetical protein
LSEILTASTARPFSSLYIGTRIVTKSIIELKKADLTLGNAAASVHVLKNINLSIG